MSHFVRCDRCAREEHVLGTITLPPGWQKIMSADLCEPCCMIVRDFIRFKPSDAEALPIEPASTEPPPAPAEDGTKLFETKPEEQCVTPVDFTAAPMTDSAAVGAIGAQTPHAGTMKTTIPTLTTSTKTTESQALETSTEERARERKKRRMRSQSAILPDAPTPKLGVQP